MGLLQRGNARICVRTRILMDALVSSLFQIERWFQKRAARVSWKKLNWKAARKRATDMNIWERACSHDLYFLLNCTFTHTCISNVCSARLQRARARIDEIKKKHIPPYHIDNHIDSLTINEIPPSARPHNSRIDFVLTRVARIGDLTYREKSWVTSTKKIREKNVSRAYLVLTRAASSTLSSHTKRRSEVGATR